MDWDHAVTPRRVLLWPDAPAVAGQLLGGHLMSVHLDGIRGDGHLEGTHLLDEYAYPASAVVFETQPWVFGQFRHAVVTEDAVGNAITDGVAVHGTVVNSAPPPADDLLPTQYESGADQMTFSFSQSDRLTG